jgi:cobalt-zinc-cadmium efflux system outer membrane protein
LAQSANTPRPLTWQETVAKFRSNNPTLLAGLINIQESRADELTAYLRPNPDLNLGLDQITPFSTNPYRPLANTYAFGSMTYLHEREHKRELRLASARQATAIAVSSQADLERTLLYSLREAFVRVLAAKAVLGVARENLEYYDKEIEINRQRFDAGAISRADFQRVDLQRIQYESDVQTAETNLRTAKIDLISFMGEKIAIPDFDIDGTFDFGDIGIDLPQLRQMAVSTRPDLKEAQQSVEKSRTDHQLAIANGSTDPDFGIDGSHQPPPLNTYIGISVSVPLRIFDRNQGEKLRTQLDIGRSQKLRDAAEVAALHDVDSAYATVESTLTLLRPYKDKYLKEAEEVRDTVSFAYQHGAASLLDFLDAQKQYRDTQLNYVNLVGSYLAAANQLNLAVGSEVIR